MPTPDIKIVTGQPTDHELAALATVLTHIDSEERAKAAQLDVTRDNWGVKGADHNPSAFRNVRYY